MSAAVEKEEDRGLVLLTWPELKVYLARIVAKLRPMQNERARKLDVPLT